ncbi:MAG: helix-turn-helix transcriptional regulator, partial [Psychromonas sp.]|nr:helix-turn-helix transcriptional regulator [Psychromonas sp.]
YGSLVQPHGFMDFITELSDCLNLFSGAIAMFNKEINAADIVWVKGLDVQKTLEYSERYGLRDGLAQRLNKALPGELIVLGEQELEQARLVDPECVQAVNELGVYYAAGVVLAYDACWTSRLYFQRNQEQGEFSLEECQLMKKILPHIQHAVQLYHIKLNNDKQRLLSEHLFDQILLPVILLDEVGKVSHCNQQAKLFISRHQHLNIVGNRLQWVNIRNTRQIKQAAEQCLSEQGTCILPLEAVDCTAIVLTFVPLVNSKTSNKSGLAVFIYRQEQLPVNQKILSELYNLSSKEAQVCCELIAGRSPADIAETVHLSYETVRTYIKRVMKKAETKRQSELVAKILASPACNIISLHNISSEVD